MPGRRRHLEEEQRKKDAERTAFLNSLDIEVLRFTNEEVLTDINSVLARIRAAVEARGGEVNVGE